MSAAAAALAARMTGADRLVGGFQRLGDNIPAQLERATDRAARYKRAEIRKMFAAGGPPGDEWAPITEWAKAVRKRNKSGFPPLVDTRSLLREFSTPVRPPGGGGGGGRFRAEGSGSVLRFETAKPYAPLLNDGGTFGDTNAAGDPVTREQPARQFAVFTDEDEERIPEFFGRSLQDAMRASFGRF